MKGLTLPDNAPCANIDGRPTALAEGKVDCSEKHVSHSAFSLFVETDSGTG